MCARFAPQSQSSGPRLYLAKDLNKVAGRTRFPPGGVAELGLEDPKVLKNLAPRSRTDSPGTRALSMVATADFRWPPRLGPGSSDETSPDDCLAENYFTALTFRVRVAFLSFAAEP
jgi:hypothetical protein